LNLPSNDDMSCNDSWLRIHYFTAAAWHDAKDFEQAELFLQIAIESRLLTSDSRELPPEIREIAFNIYSLRSDNVVRSSVLNLTAHSYTAVLGHGPTTRRKINGFESFEELGSLSSSMAPRKTL
ncbi:hypothetical protein BVRB_030830, partial [Beta vulgaris subsp. vulgaris]